MSDARRQKAHAVAIEYIGAEAPLKELGSGAEGFVFATPSDTALKIFSNPDNFARELAVYQRFSEHKVIDVLGLSVPRLVNFNRRLLVIEMTMVEPPFLLDFSQARLDEGIDFSTESDEETWERFADDFGDHLSEVRDVVEYLRWRFGIFYYDIAPRNINFEHK